MWVRSDQLLLKDQRHLPEDQRQSGVLLRFRRPASASMLGHFHAIQLNRRTLDSGEDNPWQASIWQPTRVGIKPCPNCGVAMVQVGPSVSRCQNNRCRLPTGEPTSMFRYMTGPVRGVVAVHTLPEFVVHRQQKILTGFRTLEGGEFSVGQEWLDRAILVLDRRYPTATLADVKRVAGVICDQLGWGLM